MGRGGLLPVILGGLDLRSIQHFKSKSCFMEMNIFEF